MSSSFLFITFSDSADLRTGISAKRSADPGNIARDPVTGCIPDTEQPPYRDGKTTERDLDILAGTPAECRAEPPLDPEIRCPWFSLGDQCQLWRRIAGLYFSLFEKDQNVTPGDLSLPEERFLFFPGSEILF
jgi:hypothetical protein